MLDKKTAIVVCGINNHIVLIEKLKKRGFYTILIDASNNNPARNSADEFIQLDIFDFEGIKKCAVERDADIIINACQEHLNAGICKICEELGLPHPYSYETALAISNKELMKKRMKEYDVPTTDFICISSPEELDSPDLKLPKFPLFVKSCAGSGSNAVNRASSVEEAKIYAQKALQKYPNGKVIIETGAIGNEYNVYCFPKDGKANVLLIARRYTDNFSEDKVTKLIGTLAPALISEEAVKNIHITADKITKAFSLDNVPMFMQIMVNGNDINVIEFAGRMAGGFGYKTILESTGFDWFEATINTFLGIENKVSYNQPDEYITVSHIYGKPCVFGELKGYKELIDKGVLKYALLPKKQGIQVTGGSANGSLVAYMIHKDKTISGLAEKIKQTMDEIELYSMDGESCLNKSLYLTEEIILS